MRNSLSLSLLAGLLLAACSGGSSEDGSSVRIKCNGGQAFCIISCDLGCTQIGCAMTEIAENQRLNFKFSDRVDPASVNASSISIRTASGAQPDGELLVVGQEVAFIPRINTVNGVSTFGFLRNESYIITLAGGPTAAQGVRSLAGDTLTQEFTCTVRATLGVNDTDGQPPTAALLSPTVVQGAPLVPTIILRFSELVDTTALQTSLSAASPVRIELRGTLSTGECADTAGAVVTGVPSLSVDLVDGRPCTVLQFVPPEPLQGAGGSAGCVTVYVTADLRDLSGRAAVPQEFQFFTVDSAPEVITLTESFNTDAGQDALTSGGTWSNGARPGLIGGDGRHGSFSASSGTSLGNGVYEWNTGNAAGTGGGVILPNANNGNQPEQVNNGEYFFTDFIVPVGTTVRFVGGQLAKVRVRGRVEVAGNIDVSGVSHQPGSTEVSVPNSPPTLPVTPTITGRLSAYDALGPDGATAVNQVPGVPGTAGGCGAGSGGDGGIEPHPTTGNTGGASDGRSGGPAKVSPSHFNLAAAANTFGRGSGCWPTLGTLAAAAPILVGTSIRSSFSRGGSGGGFVVAGAVPAAPTIPANNLLLNPPTPSLGTAPVAGAAFPLFPFPPPGAPAGYQSLVHFLVAGSGGGGGGSHPFGVANTSTANNTYVAGYGGTGGGGGVAIRAGGDVTISGSLKAKGGDGVLINGDDKVGGSPPAGGGGIGGLTVDAALGVSSPGGGGSGGSFVIQSGRELEISGSILTNGGTGSRTGGILPQLLPAALNGVMNIQAAGGNGSDGFYRLEDLDGAVVFTGTVNVPVFNPAQNQGILDDRDDQTGDWSTWRRFPRLLPPTWLRYELDVDNDGDGTVDFTYTDAGAPGVPTSATTPVKIRFQGAMVEGNVPLPGTIKEWRDGIADPPGLPINGIQGDFVTGFRFELTYNRAFFPTPNFTVKALRVFAES